MGWSLKHLFHSPKTDGPDSTLVKPSNWNDEHVLLADTDGVVLGRTAGSGAGPIETIPMSSLIPAGFILPYAGATVPGGWALCYGQLFNRLANAALFAAIGTTYGAGDGSTTFAGPDFRGVSLVGKSNMGGTDRGNLAGGSVLGVYLGGQYNSAGVSASAVNNINFGNVGLVGGVASGPSSQSNVQGGGGVTVPDAGASFSVSGYTPINGNFNIGVSGGTASFSIVQPSVAINFLIKL